MADRDLPAPVPDQPGVGDWDAMYDGTPPWDIGRPQPAFAALAEAGRLAAPVLDAGCGTGEHTLLASSAGAPATGVDVSPTALDKARAKAAERGIEARFELGDALHLSPFGPVATVLDSGLFHVFDDDGRAAYVASLASVVTSGGRVFLLCFSDQVPGDFGPRRVSQDEIRAAFADGWEVEAIESSHMDVTFDPTGVHAWLATVRRS